MKAVVLAAGFGKRLHPLTVNRPKHVLPLAGKPLVARIVDSVIEAGVDEVGVLVGYRSELIAEALKTFEQGRLKYIEQKEIAGTGAALRDCRQFLAGEKHFLVVYGDLTVDAHVLKQLLSYFVDGGFDGAVAAVMLEGSESYGVVEMREGLLVRVREKERLSGPVNAGIYVLDGSVFDALSEVKLSPRGEIELTDALNILASWGKRIGVKIFDRGWWFDVGRPTDYLAANQTYLRKFFNQHVVVEGSVSLGCGVSLKGPIYLGPGVTVERLCSIEGPTMVCGKTTIKEGTVVKGSVILENCLIGPRSRVVNSIVCENSVFSEGLEVLGEGSPAYVCEPGYEAAGRVKVG
ncbi:MAG: sugar phosphate nucleotidyltransferase [Candidatus Caldarchaeum sp.]|nr:sugar phosphate nucleotidyltransferase [Candidatus Caldarchaeum sp.]